MFPDGALFEKVRIGRGRSGGTIEFIEEEELDEDMTLALRESEASEAVA